MDQLVELFGPLSTVRVEDVWTPQNKTVAMSKKTSEQKRLDAIATRRMETNWVGKCCWNMLKTCFECRMSFEG